MEEAGAKAVVKPHYDLEKGILDFINTFKLN